MGSKQVLTRRHFLLAAGVGVGAAALHGTARAQENPFAITHGPCLQTPCTDEMTITWHTSRNGVSTVHYGIQSEMEHSAVCSRAGLLPNESTCHAVRLTGLKPGTTYKYKVVSTEFKGYKTPYKPEFGNSTQSDVFTFKTLDPDKAGFSFLMWNDIHDDRQRLEGMFKSVTWQGVDFVVFNGDIVNDFNRPSQVFDGFYDASVKRFARMLPMVFVRGNHETRGPLARHIADYFPGYGGRFYWSFDHGPVHFVVLDSGEDKRDDHPEYAGLVEFSSYRQEQAEWLRADLSGEAARRAKFRVILSHQPPVFSDWFGIQEIRRLWTPIVNENKAHLWLAGHMHELQSLLPGQCDNNTYHAIVNANSTTARVDVNADALDVSIIDAAGKTVLTRHIEP